MTQTPLRMQAALEFLSNSTIHGLSHIGSAKSWCVRIFWSLVVAASFGAAIYLISSSYIEWTESPVSSTTITRPIDELHFPEVTVCPPKGSNTVLNQALSQVKDEKMTPGLRERLKKKVQEIFIETPSKKFAKDMAQLMNIPSLKYIADGTVSIPEKNRVNSAEENEILINTSLPQGSFSTPGYKDPSYQGDFCKTSHLIHFQLDISSYQSEVRSMVVEVDVADGVEWQYRKQDKKLKLYAEKLTFTEAEGFCLNKGSHLAPAGSEEMWNEVLLATRGAQHAVWLGGTDKAVEGNWTWLDGTPWNFTKWAKDEPNNNGNNEDCMQLEKDRLWHDIPCSFENHVLCIVVPTTIKGKRRIHLEGNKTSSIDIWWKHNSSQEIRSDVGIKVTWALNIFEEMNNDEGMTNEKPTEFWKKSRPALRLFTQKKTTWYQAELVCVDNGGHLASITSKNEFEDFKTFVNETYHTEHLWLGGSDEAVEGNWTWSDGRFWKEEHWNRNEPDGRRGENCLMWEDGWADANCEGIRGFICRLPTTTSTFFKVAKFVDQVLKQGVELADLWYVVLKQRWAADNLVHCPDPALTGRALESIERELIADEKSEQEDFDPDNLQATLEIFSLLYFCPPQQLVEAIKLGIFYRNLLENENLRTLVMAVMNNISPKEADAIENKDLLHEFFTGLDKEFDLQLEPALVALSSELELEEMSRLELPIIASYKDPINKCIGEEQNCSQLDSLVQSSGKWCY